MVASSIFTMNFIQPILCECVVGFSLPHFSTFIIVIVDVLVFDKCVPMCCQISWKKSAKLFNVQTFDTNTNEIFIFAWCFCFFYFIFCLSLLYFCWFLCSVPWLLPVLCSRGGYNTQTHSFYCEKFKFI